jgi:hypothetical protein
MLALLAGCSDGDGTGPASRVRRVDVIASSEVLFVGTTGVATAEPRDVDGALIEGLVPRWRSSSPAVLTVDEAGVLTAVARGTAVITATVDGVAGSTSVRVEDLPAASIQLTPGTSTLARLDTLRVRARVLDQLGREIVGRPIGWSSSEPGVASIDAAGLVRALSVGSTTIRATIDDREATATITVTIPVAPGGPAITTIEPALLLPGATAVLRGSGFGVAPTEHEVRIAGVVTTVLAASPTELTVQVPTSGFGCRAAGPAVVQVARGAAAGVLEHPLRSAPQRSLALGEHVVLPSAAASACLELPAGGRYVLSVVNGGTAAGAGPGLRLRGRAGLDPTAVTLRLAPSDRPLLRLPDVSAPAPGLAGLRVGQALREAELDAHARLLTENAAIVARTPVPVGAPRARAAISAQTSVGTIVPMRIPNVGGFLAGGADFCQNNFAVNARVVHNGTRALVLEDTATTFNGQPTLVGQSDSLYRALGQEVDALMFGLVEQHFGSPLRMDDQLDDNGRVIMLFSPRINGFGNLAGFVVSCDFFPRTTFPSSNVGEVFYAIVPTSAGTGLQVGTRAYWYWTMRSTVVHELKHIAAYANRIRDFGGTSGLEEAWLEEGTARHAEELWARRAAYRDLPTRSNATYSSTLACDVRPQGQQGRTDCIGAPYAMYRHLGSPGGLYEYLSDPSPRSPLGARLGGSDVSWYASSWSLVRWAIDVHDLPEAAALTSLVRTGQKGATNLTARIGRSWEELLAEWSLAMYLDDLPGVTVSSTRLSFPAWQLGDIFAGMRADFPSTYARSYPLVPRALSFGAFDVSVPTINGGSFAMFELSGVASGTQLLELSAPDGSTASPLLRLALVRVQ